MNMITKLTLTTFATIALTFALVQYANTEPNYAYKIYNPNDIAGVSKSVSTAKNDSQIVFIVDFSNSMNDEINGKTKLDMARSTLAEILPKISPNVKVGLRIYGHKTGFTYLQGCQASKLLVPLGMGNYQNILSSLYSNNAMGWTWDI